MGLAGNAKRAIAGGHDEATDAGLGLSGKSALHSSDSDPASLGKSASPAAPSTPRPGPNNPSRADGSGDGETAAMESVFGLTSHPENGNHELVKAAELEDMEAETRLHRELLEQRSAAAAVAATELEAAAAAHAEAETQVKELLPKVKEAFNAVTGIETQAEEAHERLNESKSFHEETVKRVDEIRTAHEEKSRELQALDAEADRLAALISEFEMKLRDARSQAHVIDTQLGPLRRKHSASQKAYKEVAGQPDEAWTAVEAHRRKEAEFRESVARSRLVVAEAEEAATARRTEAAQRKAALDEATARCAEAKSAEEEARTAAKEAEAQLATLQQQKTGLQAEHETLVKQAS